jgi:hypothetical protein
VRSIVLATEPARPAAGGCSAAPTVHRGRDRAHRPAQEDPAVGSVVVRAEHAAVRRAVCHLVASVVRDLKKRPDSGVAYPASSRTFWARPPSLGFRAVLPGPRTEQNSTAAQKTRYAPGLRQRVRSVRQVALGARAPCT